jgi:hypothetical protein
VTDIRYMADSNDPSRTFQMRVRKSFMDKIDAWRREQVDLPPQAEAIRRLVEKGLEADRAEPKKRR